MNWLNNLFKKKIIQEVKPIPAPDVTPNTIEISLPVQYNTQRDNAKFSAIAPSSQCGYTTIAMVLSRFIPEANSDMFISDIIVTFEKNFLAGKGSRFGTSMANHVKIYQYYLDKYKLNKEIVFIPSGGTLQNIIDGLQSGSSVEFSWMATPYGHYSVITGYSEIKKSLEINDPWAKFDFSKKAYSTQSGERNIHSIELITPYMNQSSATKKGYRLLYLKDKI